MRTGGGLVSGRRWDMLVEKIREKREDIPEQSEAKRRDQRGYVQKVQVG